MSNKSKKGKGKGKSAPRKAPSRTSSRIQAMQAASSQASTSAAVDTGHPPQQPPTAEHAGPPSDLSSREVSAALDDGTPSTSTAGPISPVDYANRAASPAPPIVYAETDLDVESARSQGSNTIDAGSRFPSVMSPPVSHSGRSLSRSPGSDFSTVTEMLRSIERSFDSRFSVVEAFMARELDRQDRRDRHSAQRRSQTLGSHSYSGTSHSRGTSYPTTKDSTDLARFIL